MDMYSCINIFPTEMENYILENDVHLFYSRIEIGKLLQMTNS